MKREVKYVVLPFRCVRGRFHPAEMRKADNEGHAVRLAELLSEHYSGAVAIEVLVDMESGEMTSPRMLAEHGTMPDLREMLSEAA